MSVSLSQLNREVKALESWPSIEHVCVRNTSYSEDLVLHLVMAPKKHTSIQVTNLRDAGFSIVAFGLFSSEVSGCSPSDKFGTKEHLLVHPRGEKSKRFQEAKND